MRINGKEATNIFNEYGFVTNPLMNVQRTSTAVVPAYEDAVLSVLTHPNVRGLFEAHFKRAVGLKTWNHFEANPVTTPHCDAHFWTQDVAFGELLGLWVALEDIHFGAGRLYVYPHSHDIDLRPLLSDIKTRSRRKSALNIYDPFYLQSMVNTIKAKGWVCTAPALEPGDVVVWDSRTIHGSLPTTSPEHSRHSLTAHYTLARGRFITDRTRRRSVNGISVPFPKLRIGNFLRRLFQQA